jgi:hypothetical protein
MPHEGCSWLPADARNLCLAVCSRGPAGGLCCSRQQAACVHSEPCSLRQAVQPLHDNKLPGLCRPDGHAPAVHRQRPWGRAGTSPTRCWCAAASSMCARTCCAWAAWPSTSTGARPGPACAAPARGAAAALSRITCQHHSTLYVTEHTPLQPWRLITRPQQGNAGAQHAMSCQSLSTCVELQCCGRAAVAGPWQGESQTKALLAGWQPGAARLMGMHLMWLWPGAQRGPGAVRTKAVRGRAADRPCRAPDQHVRRAARRGPRARRLRGNQLFGGRRGRAVAA